MVEVLNKFPAMTATQVTNATGACTFPLDLAPAAASNLGSPVAVSLTQLGTLLGGSALLGTLGQLLMGASNTVTAFAGGGQGSATPLTNVLNRVSTVASGSDSVALPLAVAGEVVFIANPSANTLAVFGAGTDTINDVATATGVTQATLKHGVYFCTQSAPAGKWYRVLSA